jgi:hypothetical protein
VERPGAAGLQGPVRLAALALLLWPPPSSHSQKYVNHLIIIFFVNQHDTTIFDYSLSFVVVSIWVGSSVVHFPMAV